MSCKNCKCKNKELKTISFASHMVMLKRKERIIKKLKIALVVSWIVEAAIITVIMLH